MSGDSLRQAGSEAAAGIEQAGIVAVLRLNSMEGALDTAAALVDGGISCLEVTMTTPGALEILELCCHRFGDTALVGAGSVIDVDETEQVIATGARFVVGPVFAPEVLKRSHALGVPMTPGAFSSQRDYELLECRGSHG
jgi:2-dehydro-3-deoxyphosphogluconate aldolase/(4S)-4-hydroxy-2-oxoglutarate aldolase